MARADGVGPGGPAARAADHGTRTGPRQRDLGPRAAALERLWAALSAHPEVTLKRELWDGLLREAYGTAVGDDALFLQHTYLTIVAKTIAARVLDLPTAVRPTSSPAGRSQMPASGRGGE